LQLFYIVRTFCVNIIPVKAQMHLSNGPCVCM